MFDFSKHRDGLFWPSLFSSPKEALVLFCHQKLDREPARNRPLLVLRMLESADLEPNGPDTQDPLMQQACERVALQFMMEETDFARDVLPPEEYEKAMSVYSRRQYSSKVLQKLLACFTDLLDTQECKHLNNLFTLPVLNTVHSVQEEELQRKCGPLRKEVERIASGVKSICYFHAESVAPAPFTPLGSPLNDYVIDHFGYDFNAACTDSRDDGTRLFTGAEGDVRNRKVLQLTLLNDPDFWQEHERFCVITFINETAKHHSPRHAEKILTHVFKNFREIPHADLVLENAFPLWVSSKDTVSRALEEQAHISAFARLKHYCDVSAAASVPLCYPLTPADQACLETGKHIWEKFIAYQYGASASEVREYLKRELEHPSGSDEEKHRSVPVILDMAPFRFLADSWSRRVFQAYCPDAFTPDRILDRVYLKTYAVTLLAEDETTRFSYLQRIFVDLIKTIEQQTGIGTVYQTDSEARTRCYAILKSKLEEMGITVGEEYRDDYLISLLDRDTALIREAERFPVLEQLGDAVYGLAVAELLFYNPATGNMAELFETYTRAQAQVRISVRHGFDRLYLHSGLPAKYTEYDSLFTNQEAFVLNEEHLQSLNREKYLADSLEMLIGTICLDAGVVTALSFTKDLIHRTFPEEFPPEVRPTEENRRNRNIDTAYWSKILPAPCSTLTQELAAVHRALNKLVLALVLGTEDQDARKFITYNADLIPVCGDTPYYGVTTWFLYDYLSCGLPFVLDRYSHTVRDFYQKHAIRHMGRKGGM